MHLVFISLQITYYKAYLYLQKTWIDYVKGTFFLSLILLIILIKRKHLEARMWLALPGTTTWSTTWGPSALAGPPHESRFWELRPAARPAAPKVRHTEKLPQHRQPHGRAFSSSAPVREPRALLSRRCCDPASPRDPEQECCQQPRPRCKAFGTAPGALSSSPAGASACPCLWLRQVVSDHATLLSKAANRTSVNTP